MNKRILLLVEDEELHVKLFTRNILRVDASFEVVVAKDGLEGMQYIEAHHTELDTVLLDLNLPKLNGMQILERIRNNPNTANLRVVIITSSDDVQDVQRAKEQQATGYIVKPVSYQQLRQWLA
jgi:CheY-like chemotaxis protein